MKEDWKWVAKEIRRVLKDDDYIPARFNAWNTLAWALGLTASLAVLKKKAILLGIITCLEPLCCLKMNQEMAKFMEAMLNERRKL